MAKLKDLTPRVVRPLGEWEDHEPQRRLPKGRGPQANWSQQYYENNRDRIIERASEWAKNNRERINQRRKHNRHQKAGAAS